MTVATRSLQKPPALGPLYLRAALSLLPAAGRLPWLPGGPPRLPDLELVLEQAQAQPEPLRAYRALCGFRDAQQLPPTYPHLLAFPLQMAIMCDPAFPFSPVGLVHTENALVLHRPLSPAATLRLRATAQELSVHRRGSAVVIATTAWEGEGLVWEERSTFLRVERRGTEKRTTTAELPAGEEVELSLPAELGRRYAALSGDRNPIHTSRVGARLFGFSTPIAHGMWLKARALGALEERLPDRFKVIVRFRRPVPLPSSVSLRVCAPGGERLRFLIHRGSASAIHLEGEVEKLR